MLGAVCWTIPTAASMHALHEDGIDLFSEHRADIPDALTEMD